MRSRGVVALLGAAAAAVVYARYVRPLAVDLGRYPR